MLRPLEVVETPAVVHILEDEAGLLPAVDGQQAGEEERAVLVTQVRAPEPPSREKECPEEEREPGRLERGLLPQDAQQLESGHRHPEHGKGGALHHRKREQQQADVEHPPFGVAQMEDVKEQSAHGQRQRGDGGQERGAVVGERGRGGRHRGDEQRLRGRAGQRKRQQVERPEPEDGDRQRETAEHPGLRAVGDSHQHRDEPMVQGQVAARHQGFGVVEAVLLFVVDERLRMEEVAVVMAEAQCQGVVVGLRPGVDVARRLVEMPHPDTERHRRNDEQRQ